jgi:rhodanese-related sulfurtransferase
MKDIDLRQFLELQNHGAQVVEVLPQRQYEGQHIPGATNLPLSKFNSARLATLDKARPVVVYCWDYQ